MKRDQYSVLGWWGSHGRGVVLVGTEGAVADNVDEEHGDVRVGAVRTLSWHLLEVLHHTFWRQRTLVVQLILGKNILAGMEILTLVLVACAEGFEHVVQPAAGAGTNTMLLVVGQGYGKSIFLFDNINETHSKQRFL